MSKDNFAIEAEVAQGYTMYGLSIISGCEIEDLMEINSLESINLDIGEKLLVPMTSGVLLESPSSKSHLPVYIEVMEGDNLYRLTKVFDLASDQLISLNSLNSSDLKEGQKLLIGWIDWPYVELAIEENQDSSIQAIYNENDELTFSIYDTTSVIQMDVELPTIKKKPVRISRKGIAYCERTSVNIKELIVMHRSARVNSKISLYNPMLRRKVNATVVGELPKEAYPEDVSVVISSSVAKALGALDKRFLVEMTYVE